jgi:AcrR family transcriptional regulator
MARAVLESVPQSVPRRLVAVATRLFADQGYENTSVQQIVESAGLTKGALYHYFDAKDDLLQEIYTRLLRMQMDRLEAFVGGSLPLANRLRSAAADVIVTTIENLDENRVFFRSMHLLSEKRQRLVRAERRRYHERFRSMVEDGQRTGLFRADVPADLVVDYFFGSVHHLGS